MDGDVRTTEQQIVALESRLQHATPTSDASTTDEILAEDWLNSNANGSLSTKAQSLAVIDKLPVQFLRDQVNGYIDASAEAELKLSEIFPEMAVWQRVIYELETLLEPESPPGLNVRCLAEPDRGALEDWGEAIPWLYETWSNSGAMAKSGRAWGGYVDNELVSLAYIFLTGDEHEELGVVTHPAHHGKGYAGACGYWLCVDSQNRQKTAVWATGAEMNAYIRVAKKLGFRYRRSTKLYVTDRSYIPE
jgi:RimJ/RimL family protein N-acetyltransferase